MSIATTWRSVSQELPVLSAPFRPLFLLGAGYGPLVLAMWSAAYLGLPSIDFGRYGLTLWHAHEMTFGFTAAVVCGFVLTALATWAGTPEIVGARLGLVVLAWFAGRLVFWFPDIVSMDVASACDLALFPVVAALATPSLMQAPKKRFLGLLPILAWIFGANVVFHVALQSDDHALAFRAIAAGLYGFMMLFNIIGGLLTPIFAESELAERGRSVRIAVVPSLEATAIVAVVAFAVANTFLPESTAATVTATIACMANVVRMMRWPLLRILDLPLIIVMYLGFAWFTVAIGLHAIDAGTVGRVVALHAFTVGALGLMKMSLMTRVALRHTGRPVRPGPMVVAAFWIMAMAPILRLTAEAMASPGLMVASAAAWGLPFIMLLFAYASYLVRPSLPQTDLGLRDAA